MAIVVFRLRYRRFLVHVQRFLLGPGRLRHVESAVPASANLDHFR